MNIFEALAAKYGNAPAPIKPRPCRTRPIPPSRARGFDGWRNVVVRSAAESRQSRERLEAFFARRRAAWKREFEARLVPKTEHDLP